jgi:hypothetical protein
MYPTISEGLSQLKTTNYDAWAVLDHGLRLYDLGYHGGPQGDSLRSFFHFVLVEDGLDFTDALVSKEKVVKIVLDLCRTHGIHVTYSDIVFPVNVYREYSM